MLAAMDELWRRLARAEVIDRILTVDFYLRPGRWVRRGEVVDAVAAALNEPRSRSLHAEVNERALMVGYRPVNTNGRRIYRRLTRD